MEPSRWEWLLHFDIFQVKPHPILVRPLVDDVVNDVSFVVLA